MILEPVKIIDNKVVVTYVGELPTNAAIKAQILDGKIISAEYGVNEFRPIAAARNGA